MELSKEAREAKKRYMKKWRDKPENKEKIKAYQEKYWSKKVQDLLSKPSN